MNTVLLPVFNRPELFFFVIEGLLEARGANLYKYVVAAEYGYSPEYIPLLQRLQNEIGAQVVCNFATRKLGGTANTLEGLKAAQALTDEYTIILEDDHYVSRDFFETLDAMYRNHYRDDIIALHCSAGRKVKDDPEPPPEDIKYAIEYQPAGACIPKAQFNKYLVQHCHPGYYDHKMGYLWKNFRESSLGTRCPFPDGLVWRIREKHHLLILQSVAGRVRHIGFYGANRNLLDPNFASLSFVEKVQKLESVIWDPDQLRALSSHDWGDYWHVERDHEWESLRIVNPEFNPYVAAT